MRDTARFLPGALLLLGAALVAGCGAGSEPAGEPGDLAGWNVLLVTLDTTRWDRLGCYGLEDAGTPVIDRLAADGVLFENAVAQAPITLPTHSSIFTGTYPPFHGVRGNGFYTLPEERTTLAEILADAGYDTGAVVAARVLDRRFGLAQGFRIFEDDPRSMSQDIQFGDYTRRAPAVNEAARAVADQFDRSKPYFLWVHYFDPHAPYDPLPELAPAFADTSEGRYQAEIATVDRYLGRLIDELRARGMMKRTLVVLTADHGEGFLGAHEEQSHGIFVYGDTLRVPLIFTAEGGLPSRLRLDDLVRQIDIAPTVLDLLRLDEADEAQGVSFRARMLDGEAVEAADIVSYSEAILPWYKYGWAPLLSVRDRRWKYIDAPRPELYDLVADPDELDNVAVHNPDVVARLREKLAEILAQGTGLDGFSNGLVESDAEREKLRALGYVDTGRQVPAGESIRSLTGLKDPKDSLHLQNRLHQARELYAAGKRDDALRELEDLVTIDANNYDAYSVLIELLMSSGRLDDAEARIREVLAFRPIWKVWLIYGQLERRRSRELSEAGNSAAATAARERAMAHLQQAGERGVVETDPWIQLGALHYEAGQVKDAETALRRARAIDDRSYVVNSTLGIVLVDLKKNVEACEVLEAAIAVAPDRASERRVRLQLMDALVRLGDLDRAEASIRWIEANFPDDPSTPRARAIFEQARARQSRAGK